MAHRGSETEFELATIERLERLGYRHIHGSELDRPLEEVVLRDRLKAFLARQYPDLPRAATEEALNRLSRPEGVDTLRRNMAFHEALTRGIEVRVEGPGGRVEHRHVYAVNWDHPEGNEFLVVNQFSVRGRNDRRPDVVVFVNGLPLAAFELKNPWDPHPTVENALNQLAHYRHDIPQLFEFNAVTVVSDGVTTLHGTWDAPPEWFSPWRSIDGEQVEPGTTASMKTLIEGLFRKDRFLDYIRHFILFEVANEKVAKKGAKYHQYFAVCIAADKAAEASRADADRRIGVIWHTTGSGKSLSMVFLVGILRRRLANPTFVIEVDRADLDDQLHDQFVYARALVGGVKHADSVDELRELLRTEGGEIIFTTIEKFRLKRDSEGATEVEHPVLSTRSDIILIADEAHRSQYGFLKGYARYLAEALPHARRIGFTGTPISFSGADTVEVFGDLIHTYDIKQSQEDRATVPIYYAPRQVRLHLTHADVDAALQEITAWQKVTDLERRKSRWAALAQAAGARERVDEIAGDLLAHFRERTATLDGKALVVCMTRENCVRLYNALTALPGCPEVKVVMTGNLGEDPVEWSQAGHITTKPQREAIKARMVDPDDPLKIAIVCDMWLTGTDIPCLHTLYLDKPMRGHTIIQAISRVNRVFRDKPHGLIVDYIGIADELREATGKYSQGGGRGEPAPGVSEEARPLFLQALAAVREMLPEGYDYGAWRRLSPADLEDRYALVFGHLTDSDERRDAFLQAELRLSHAYLLVKHLDECRPHADEVIFYQRVRKELGKTLPGAKPGQELERAVRDLVDDSVESQGMVDIFKIAGIARADISILDDAFLQTFKDRPLADLRLRLLTKLVSDEIQARQPRNLAQAQSFKELLEQTLQRYHNRLIDAAAVIKAMLEIRLEMSRADERAAQLGLEADELAFYDAVAAQREAAYGVEVLRDLIHEVVQVIKRTLKVDWTEPHRDDVKAAVRGAVRRVLRARDVKAEDFEPFLAAVMAQAEALYTDWPLAA
ncbi:MAG: type I restriction endonuclease subunit R [Candidatus Rokubacteria bacterium]|nr:type I restriction endonuclease subunit R [Candidatus Rokubacteria bacterium]